MSRDTGGPAFPSGPYDDVYDKDNCLNPRGMTLRDYFAAKAMQAHMTKLELRYLYHEDQPAETAGHAYKWADAMIAERSK